MKRQNALSIVMFATILTVGACASQKRVAVASAAQDDSTTNVTFARAVFDAPAEPATQPTESAPALPAGHPPIGAMAPTTQPGAGGMPGLPKGHPDISALTGGNNPAAGQLPAGHPDISKLSPQDAKNAPKSASITVKAEQGTIGGPAIGAADVTVEVVAGDQVVGKIDTKLNDKGTITISGLPVGAMYQPVVTVKYQGVMYQASGNPIDGAAQTLSVKVYETTDKPIDWEVRMRHVMLQPAPEGGVQVMDMIAIDNATDRAYVGVVSAADGAKKVFEIPLPAGATNVQFSGGFHDCCTKVQNGKVINTMAIVPGTTQYQLSYVVPVKDGKTEITASAPAITKHLIVFAPDDGTTISASDLESGTTKMGESQVRYFKSESIPAAKTVTLTISGTPNKSPKKAGGAVSGASMSGGDIADVARAVAGGGALVIFLLGGAIILRKVSAGSVNA